jgi:hypothetical protein
MAKTVIIQAQQKWDYRTETRRTDASLIAAMNELGQFGWEAVDVIHHKDPKGEMAWTVFLKRPSAAPSPVPAPQQSATSVVVPANESPTPAPHGEPQGFDLSDEEFQIKAE